MTIIISRHPGAIEWLKRHHPELSGAKVLKHAVPDDLFGNVVIGTLPVNLAALAKEYWHLTMDIPVEARGKELTADDMEEFGCKINRYIIMKHPAEKENDI